MGPRGETPVPTAYQSGCVPEARLRYAPILVAAPSKARFYVPVAYRVCGFESRRGHGGLSVLRVVCFQLEVSASDRLLVQRGPTDCGVSECDRAASIMRKLWPTSDCCAMVKKIPMFAS
jgi:hypothetical protein